MPKSVHHLLDGCDRSVQVTGHADQRLVNPDGGPPRLIEQCAYACFERGVRTDFGPEAMERREHAHHLLVRRWR